jgi:hypothetical protein
MKSSSFAISSTVKAPYDEVLWFAHYHLEAGASHIFLWLDDPSDPAAERIKDPRITVTRCDSSHWDALGVEDRGNIQARRSGNAIRALELAEGLGIDWVAVIDYDEILYSGRPLTEVFSQVDDRVDVLRFEVWEAAMTRHDNPRPFEDVTYFKPHPLPLQVARAGSPMIYIQWVSFILRLFIAKLLGVRSATHKTFTVGHRSGKSAMRSRCRFPAIGSHAPVPSPDQTVVWRAARGAALLHFDTCDYSGWKQKWNARQSGSLQWVGRDHRRRYMDDYQLAVKGGDESLREFFITTKGLTPRTCNILTMLGLLKKVSLRKPSID